MEILLNNRRESFDTEALTVSEVLALKKFTFRMLVVKINGELVKKEQYGSATIKHGDEVIILHLISGG
ncbi:MAG TPA: thiamine biosynthesis protein ThiS [Marinilabiliales bacterium]|jgi:thiamine biosynthesis protein ThiS|nr:MAG: thiamine biosynthesis protein ThiS [Bacteroidetes bacterium GWA2_40_14]OFX62509.1 MAG: thiamine biosynthesis protein ThiS [Bacteroidetes bacterium GWC2_40_13]OFX74216.1 MAG: thiamine biosynthesis protein ThiS [Bacteroidetes bacterium GWD2_40_43]OFX93166.1 MAG: thiamine biosynthesis protein ThiS [Bacteroidetes bacterium GWE2_40_63]OFY21536.1 MAG: thiamine biosynthesis protein ThiS [Bacteroidetes bacterium GWF2_40_13]OFZ24189.1 MAG: thiamine biosynthesis protein ThiS [Bacteroidetes bacte